MTLPPILSTAGLALFAAAIPLTSWLAFAFAVAGGFLAGLGVALYHYRRGLCAPLSRSRGRDV